MRIHHLAKRALLNSRWCLRGGPLHVLLDDNFPGPFDHLRCIFIHIPKAAGTSVALSLFGHQTGHRKYVDYWRDNRRKTRAYFKFTFVRNPWDRLVSAYHFLRAGGMNSGDRAFAEKELAAFSSFEDFVKGWLANPEVSLTNHFEPQYKYLVGLGSNDLKADFIGRVEHFDRDFQFVCDRLGVQREVFRANESRRSKDFRQHYSDQTLEIVRRVYARDIELFGYEFTRSGFKTLPLPPGEGWGESELPKTNAPSPCPLPRGEGFETAPKPRAALNPQPSHHANESSHERDAA